MIRLKEERKNSEEEEKKNKKKERNIKQHLGQENILLYSQQRKLLHVNIMVRKKTPKKKL
jgi:hypothetical protein